jgi:signal transduction histidine kinase
MSGKGDLVLYVDDERANRLVFEHTFNSKFNLKVVSSGQEALEALKMGGVAVLVTDQRMPDMSGNDLLARAKQVYPEVIRIVITAYSDLDPILSAVNDGLVARYLIKPWDREELERILTWAIEAHALGAQSSAVQLRLLETERLVTLGSIAAAVLHDLHQPLQHLTQNAGFIQSHLEAVDELRELLTREGGKLGLSSLDDLLLLTEELPDVASDLTAGCDLMTELMARLRPFAGGAKRSELPDVEPLPIIQYVLAICQNIASKANGMIVYDGASSLPRIAMDPTELTQAMINVISNAAQALIGVERDSPRVVVRAAELDAEVQIVVADNGCGIPREILPKIGTPFFSTRPQGTGLGVSQSRRFVEKAGGRLVIESSSGAGTTVTLTLPKAGVSADEG